MNKIVQETLKTLEVLDIIFSTAELIHNIFKFDPISLYDFDYSDKESDFKIEMVGNYYTVISKFNLPICKEWYNHILLNKDVFINWHYSKFCYKNFATTENLKKVIENSVILKSSTCIEYATLMCSILNKLLPHQYVESLTIQSSTKDDHVVIFLYIRKEIFVIDLWAKKFLKNKHGLICKYGDYVNESMKIGIMKYFNFEILETLTIQSKNLDLMYLLTPQK